MTQSVDHAARRALIAEIFDKRGIRISAFVMVASLEEIRHEARKEAGDDFSYRISRGAEIIEASAAKGSAPC